MTISESVIASAKEGSEAFLHEPIGEEWAAKIRETYGSSHSWVKASTTRSKLASFNAEWVVLQKVLWAAVMGEVDGLSENKQTSSDIEKAARAICVRLGYDPDRKAFRGLEPVPGMINLTFAPHEDDMHPLWEFFRKEAEAALSVLDI